MIDRRDVVVAIRLVTTIAAVYAAVNAMVPLLTVNQLIGAIKSDRDIPQITAQISWCAALLMWMGTAMFLFRRARRLARVITPGAPP